MFNKTQTIEVKATISYNYLNYVGGMYYPYEAIINYSYCNGNYVLHETGSSWKDAKNGVIYKMKNAIKNDKNIPPTEDIVVRIKVKVNK